MEIVKSNKKLLCLIFALFISCSFSQTKPIISSSGSSDLPGNMKLLDGYVHKKERGFDSSVGTINKKDGLKIQYDIGSMAGNATGVYENIKDKVIWYKKQQVNSDELWIAYFKDGRISATFVKASANFHAQTQSQEDIIDFTLMIMTYNSKVEP